MFIFMVQMLEAQVQRLQVPDFDIFRQDFYFLQDFV